MLIAYFCAEFALLNSTALYAGGLGVLARDYILQAADDNFPIIGIGLCYKMGQNSKHTAQKMSGSKLGLKLVKRNWIKKLLIEIPIENRIIFAQVWQWKYKNNSVYFLDTDVNENNTEDKLITEQLYAENRDTRLKQELILGIGGVRLIKSLGLSPNIYHLNEGHSAFLFLEVMDKEKIVFTNHTLVPEGQEIYTTDALTKNTKKLCSELNIDIKEIIKMGQSETYNNLFSMTKFALNTAILTNTVSKIHGEKARELWPEFPIIHITNGIYLPFWDKIKNRDILKAHKDAKNKLLNLIEKNNLNNFKINKKTLLIGWSRRFASYKRPLMIIEDLVKSKQLLNDLKEKIHIIYSAPLNIEDINKNDFLRNFFDLVNGELKGLVTFIPNYSTEIAETMVAGCDVWLNNPIVGYEACGTSGMKAALNGTLNLSTNDGWVNEIPLNDFGWVINDIPSKIAENVTTDSLDILKTKVLPEHENFIRDEEKSNWAIYMKKSRQLILTKFSTKRMLNEYIEKLYKPILNKKQDN